MLNTLLLVLFVFRLVFAPDRQGYAVTLAELWAQCRPLVRDGYRQPAEAAHYPQGLLSCLFQLRARLQSNANAVFAAFCRLVKYTAGTSTYVLATTLLDRSRYRIADLSDLYHARWGIEELYKISKQMLTVEQFHGQSELLVQQELSAHFSLIAMTRLFTNHSEGGYRSDPGKPALEAGERYKKIVADTARLGALLVDLFLDWHGSQPERIVLDVDATDDPLHGRQEGRFFHGYYRSYCYLPLYIFCGQQLLGARLRTADRDAAAGTVEELTRIVGRIRQRWPGVEIWLRGDSGFCREELMAWCEAQGVEYVLGITQNPRLKQRLAAELEQARQVCERTGQAARVFKDFRYRTLDSWSRERRGRCTRRCTARGGTWRTASSNSSWRCSRTSPRRRRCGPTSCACTSPPSPTRCWSCCGAGACRAPGWRGRNATRSASSCSRSACGSGVATKWWTLEGAAEGSNSVEGGTMMA